MEDHQVGEPQFDNAFVLQGNSYHELLDILKPNVQGWLLNMLRSSPNLNLSICGGQIFLAIQTDVSLETVSSQVSSFVNLRAQMLRNVFDAAGALQVAAVENEMQVVRLKDSQATCMVCGTDVEEYRVKCRRCKTPHHKDCWGYFGGCSRYGCGETVYLDAK